MKLSNRRQLISIAGGVILIVAIVVGVRLFTGPSAIPNTILRQVTFAIFYPPPSKQVVLHSFKYSKPLRQVTFIADFSGQHITFAEQSSPDSFSADPNFYPSFIQKLNGYASFSSVDGTVSLTRPAQVNSETAVMNAKGTLLFAKSSGDISEDNWKLLFNSFTYTQPS